jgi:predicted heme/steroid binding protein
MKRFVSVMILLVIIFSTDIGNATEEIAVRTGHDCGYCHLDPAGGGELTPTGEAYLKEAVDTGQVQPLSTFSKLFRLAAGYLHLLFAVLWFGTILYVHIVLKPSYAEKGLPVGEKFVGVLSFLVVGLTGFILTLYRLDSLHDLIATRFGILLSIKVVLYLVMLLSAILVINVIGPRLARREQGEHIPGQPFNPQSLRSFDGKDGRSCYFAFQGKVYDASRSKMWPGGEHMRRHSSGGDLTEQLPMAPHDAGVMHRLPMVGDYVAGEAGRTVPSRVFYCVAYMNLVIVFLILFIIALWRWG